MQEYNPIRLNYNNLSLNEKNSANGEYKERNSIKSFNNLSSHLNGFTPSPTNFNKQSLTSRLIHENRYIFESNQDNSDKNSINNKENENVVRPKIDK